MSTPLEEIFRPGAMAPADCLLAAAQAGWFVAAQPAGLADELAVKSYLQQHLAPQPYRIRQAEAADMPDLMALEAQCWPAPLRTSENVLAQRVAHYPQGQLVLLVEDAVVGVIYSQLIGVVTALDGIAAAQVDTLHDPAGTVVQLLAVNVLPQMQQHNLGDQLLEFMLTYRSLQPQVQALVAITLCKHFDAAAAITMDDYIRVRNQHGVLADPILRFHELHGATIERPMPGYRPADLKNLGYGVLVTYDIHRRTRRALQLDQTAAAVGGTDRAAILQHLQQLMQSCLPASSRSAFAYDRPLMEMGLDSADLLMLNETLSHHYRLALNPTFFFRCNTADKIADYLCNRSDIPNVPDMQAQDAAVNGEGDRHGAIKHNAAVLRPQDVAIIGIACRLPGNIDTPQAFWQCLQAGTSLVGRLPAQRWQWPQDIDPAQRHQGIDCGAFLEDVAAFDAPFFRISPAEAESMDPQQRLLLELSWQAIEHAGYAPAALSGSATGVFIGASGADYARLLERSDVPLDAHYGTGSSMAVLANRLSYYYDFNGPSLLIDTACSSSLVALHQAVQSLQSGEVAQALVGGVNLMLHPASSIAYYKAGMLARDGLCKTFDDSANGYVRSEGALMFLLKPAAAALADGDLIHAIIKGSASNHGGQSGGLTVPNPAQQARLLQAAWDAAGIDPLALGYIEAHGTGTALGDPLEVQGLAEAFAAPLAAATDTTAAVQLRCGLGSVKTNLGHLEAAAGLAGLLKTVLCLQHGRVPASLHFQRLNRHIDLAGTHLHVVAQLQDWPAPSDGAPRLAGVSSFGSGGANAHVVLAEYLPAALATTAPDHATSPCLFVLSARTRPQLLAYAHKYLGWLQHEDSAAISLAALTYQLQRGRQAMVERLAWAVVSRAELVEKLQAFCAREAQPAATTDHPSWQAPAADAAGRDAIRLLASQGDWERIALLWQAGAEIDWSWLPMPSQARIVAPTYPFARHRYWLPHSAAVVPQPVSLVPAATGATDVTGAAVVPLMLAPLWRAVAVADDDAGVAGTALHDDGLLVIGDVSAETADAEGIAALAGPCVADLAHLPERLQHIVWIAPAASTQGLIQQQEHGLLALFRLIKALLAQGYGERALRWTVVTRGTQAVFAGDPLAPAHAGVHGLAGALAKEYPRWSICALDLEEAATPDITALMRMPTQAQGEVLAYRNGQWFRRVLAPVAALPSALPVYRQRGVYVVIGGAGGIGAAWTRHVMTHYDAQVVWIGRRAPDAALAAQLTELAAVGTAPLYVSADATDADALQRAWALIRQTYPVIHGVIHCAVGQFDHSLADMDEQRFRSILAVKIDASVNLAQVFGAQALDFMLYFSSIVTLEKNGGHSGYAAGGAFEDVYATQLARQSPFSVKVINWGHWDTGTGLRISSAAKTRLQQSGRQPLQVPQALAALQQLLGAPLVQAAVLNTTRTDLLPLHDGTQELHVYPQTLPPAAVAMTPPLADGEIAQLQSHSLFGNPAMEAALLPLLAGTLAALELDGALRLERAPAFYGKWLAASRQLVAQAQQQGQLSVASQTMPLEILWQDWERARRDGLGSADLNAACTLAEACLRALPAILSGAVRATDVLFPDASMRMVEGIYRDNAVADYFNRILAESVVAVIEARLRQDPEARLRLLEIGAGTGGTTALLLPYLAPYREHIVEYAYTDLSKAFLFHAEAHFVPGYPFVAPRRFDVEQPLAGQDIAAVSYDLVIATNVLHATRDIRRTLANAKAALHKDGCLLLNEISDRSVFAHLTFGLLEGWWLSQDQPLRMPDAPGLYPQAWRQVLTQEGFLQVAFPAQQAHVLGQQVIVAASDGVVRQQTLATAPSLSSQAQSARQSPAAVAAGDEVALKAAASTHLKKVIAACLRMDSSQIDVREPLETYGIDSILIVQITNALRIDFPEVASTLLFECHTVDALAQHLLQRHQAALRATVGMVPMAFNPAVTATAAMAARAPAATAATASLADHDAIAVIGMSCRFPQARNSEEYWRLLAAGGNAVGEVPQGRWNMQGFFHGEPDEAVQQGKSYSKWGGFLDNVTDFDPLFFNISPKEALSMDPQERLFLQAAWETLEDAGYTRDRVARDFGRQLGVFAGITRTGFDLFGPQLWRQGSTLYPHTSFSSVANRVSYFLNARGPSVPVDTMCSSSLTAIHQASQSLRSGECRLAIAGGVNLYLHPSGYVGLSASRMLSKDGLCRSFGKGGNGFVPGEGVGAVLLKPLAQAQADNDRIYAVIRATHVNHGGKTNGYTVPNPQAQGELVSEALRKAGVSARAVSYIEAHGTGTELGDPIEVAGLVQAFREYTEDVGFCALGSAKSNIGHLEAAAGIAGLIKVILQLQHGQLAPTLHAAEVNPNIDFARTPFVLQQSLAPWSRPLLPATASGEPHQGTRIAGVSSFGAGGANAHVVLEEYIAPEMPAHSRDPADGQDCLIVLSARSVERLQAYAERLQAFVAQATAADAALPALADLAYTLQVGREQMDVRLALMVRTWPQLLAQLRNWLEQQAQEPAAQQEEQGIYHGQARQYKDMIAAFADDDAIQQTLQSWFQQGQHGRLLNLWSKGLGIDWEGLYPVGHARRRVAAPTYPFAPTRYWLPLEEEATLPVSATVTAATPAAPVTSVTSVIPATPVPIPAVLPTVRHLPATAVSVAAKPSAIQLIAPAALPTTFTTSSMVRVQHHLRPLVSVSEPPPAAAPVAMATPAPQLGLYDEGDGVVAIRLLNVNANVSVDDMDSGAALSACLAALQAWPSPVAPRVVLLSGLGQLFGTHSRHADTAAAAISACAVPVVAVLSGRNAAAAMTVAAACELVIGSTEGRYSDPASGVWLDGAGLRAAGYAWPLVAPDQLDRYARDAAERIAQAGTLALAALKVHLAAGFAVTAENAVLPQLPVNENPPDDEVWETVALASSVVELKKNRRGVVVVSLCERSSKNTFSPAFVEGVISAFEHINSVPDYKVVVLTGYDSYFACGGTREGLLAIQSGRARFTDEQSYRMPLSCEIPVIAAMQGHAIGAGWTMGLFCDWAVYSEESTYQSPYMLYGFTPGAGSTLIFPQRLGRALSREILLTARPFLGRELKQRAIDMPVLPRSAVLPYALALAGQLVEFDRSVLIAQKSVRSAALRQWLPQVFAQELALHDRTFVNNPDVIANIARHFTTAVTTEVSSLAPAAASQGQQVLLESLRASLSEELQLQREQFDDDATFIDLGLDSISAVTWIRKINRQFGLTLGATKVYSYPTLRQFAAFVQAQMPQETVAPAAAPAPAQSRQRSEDLLAWLRITLASELQLQPQALDDDMKFIDLGLDSITAVTWVRGINRHYGLEVGATKVYSYPCLTEFHRYVLELLATASPAVEQAALVDGAAAEVAQMLDTAPSDSQQDGPQRACALIAAFALATAADVAMVASAPVPEPIPAPAPAPAPAPSAVDPARHGIAIIGMSGQFPKADNVRQFWSNIMDGRDCVSEIPATRWPLEQFYDPDRNAEGKTVCRSMGLLETLDEFDPLFFNISPSEAEYMDPQQRLFLQNSWRCIEDAGYDPAALSGSLCGVFVGCAAGDYSQLMIDPQQTHSAQGLMGESVAILPARIAYFLNLQGPCLAIDTACSSSLVALASACDSLVLGHSEVALAGGVYVINGPDIHVKMSKAGMLSPDGRCYSFDQRANGFVPGEGVGVLMLKRLDHATRDGDDIYGVIRGWGVNQDGKTNGITAPNAQSQTRLEASIYRRFDINPEHIGLIEAHGTGTKLGDPIEVDALCATFRQFTARKHFCALGSVKSNIGHLANAAGVTGVIKALLALQHRRLPPTIHYRSLNEHITLQDSPFFVNTEGRAWPVEAGQKRLVAVSSFGFSGTNGHMVLAEADQRMHGTGSTSSAAGPLVLPLSARNRQQLQAYAQALSDYLAAADDAAAAGAQEDLMDLIHTFQSGRAAMSHRLVVIAATRAQLQARLARYALDGVDDAACISGVVLKKTIAAEPALEDGAPSAAVLAARWASGAAVDWGLLYPAGVPGRRRHGLPTYPFARERYWIPVPEPTESAPGPAPAAFDIAAWRADALVSGIDWSSRLRHWQQRRLVVLHADSARQQAFGGLLTALQQAAGKPEEYIVPLYADWQQVATMPLPARPGVLLVLATGSGTQAETDQVLAVCRHVLGAQAPGNAPDLVLSLGASAAGAVRLAEAIGVMTASAHLRCLLLTQDEHGSNAGVTMQRLCQEWLAWDGTGLRRVHYAGAQRLVPAAATAAPQTPAMYLIERQWQLQEPLPQASPTVRGEVLVLVNHESLPLARKLLRADDFSRIVLVADASVQPSQIQNAIDFSDAKSARMSAQLLTDQYDAITHVIDLSDLYDTPRDYDADKLGKMVFYQTLAGTANDLTILYCTKGLQSWQSPQMSLAGAKFAGLVKMLSADYRHIDARCIDIDQQACDQAQELRRILLQECGAQLQQTELCYRQGQRYAPLLTLHAAAHEAAQALPVDAGGVYVISGGTNGVGLELAKYLVRNGCRKLVLMGVTALPPRSDWEHALSDADSALSPYLRNKLPELMALDRQLDVLEIYTGSLSDQAELQRYFKLIRNRDGDIKGVIHCAGRYSDADTPGFASKDPEHMQQVLEPKIRGLENLHAVLHHDALDFFVALSSMTGVLPHLARGAGDYATANTFVDFFMAYQHEQQQYRQGRQRHCRYRSIVWSDWNQTGAITRISPEKAALVGQTFDALGMRTFSNREGQALFALAMQAQNGSRAFVAYVDPAQFGSVGSRLLNAHLQSTTGAAAQIPVRAVTPNLPVPALLRHLDRWEAEKRAGLEVSVHKLTEVITLEQIRHLDAALIHRIHKLLFTGSGHALVAAAATQAAPAAPAGSPGLGDDLAQLISHTVMEVLKLKSIDAASSFQDYGLDSISAMVLATRLEKRLQQPVQPQWLIDYATITTLTDFLATQRSRTP